MNGKQDNSKVPIAWPQGLMKLFILMGLLVLSLSCCQPVRQLFFETKKLVVPEMILKQESSEQARLCQTLEYLKKGELEEAQEVLTELSQEKNGPETAAISAFYLGLIKLLEMDDLAEMKDSRAYFKAYLKEYSDGPYEKNSARILLLLNKYIEQRQKDKGELKELTGQVEKQAQEIETLKYQMQKLEEIQHETERERQLLELN